MTNDTADSGARWEDGGRVDLTDFTRLFSYLIVKGTDSAWPVAVTRTLEDRARILADHEQAQKVPGLEAERDWRKQLNETDEGAAKRKLYHLREAILRAEFQVSPYVLDGILALLDEADANLIALVERAEAAERERDALRVALDSIARLVARDLADGDLQEAILRHCGDSAAIAAYGGPASALRGAPADETPEVKGC